MICVRGPGFSGGLYAKPTWTVKVRQGFLTAQINLYLVIPAPLRWGIRVTRGTGVSPVQSQVKTPAILTCDYFLGGTSVHPAIMTKISKCREALDAGH